MFPSSNSCNPFHLTTAGSLQEDPTPQFWHFPAPFINDDDDGLLMSHLLSQSQQQFFGSTSKVAPPDSEIKPASAMKETKKVTTKRKRSAGNGAKQGIPRKRTGKKDRHSKIFTAHGPRDRRMRLSLQIARKFFDLQDMLGFDKASKTIEWLFSKSKAAIKELTDNLPGVKHSCSGGGKSVSSTSESEVLSAAKECENNIARAESMKSTARATKEKQSRKASFNPVARESRDKARARARERTIEKMKMKGLEKSNKCSDESNPSELEQLQSSSPIEAGENLGSSTQTDSTLKEVEQPHQSTVHLLENQIDSVSIIEKFLGITRAPRSSSMFNYSHKFAESNEENSEENCSIFSGNWGVNNESIRYGYCAMTSSKQSTGNAQEQNPSVIFMTDPNEENPSSNLVVNSYAKVVSHNNSDLMNPSNAHEGSPTSILASSSDIGLHLRYQQNPAVASKYHHFH